MEIDLSKYYLSEPDKTVCHCGFPVHFFTQKPDVEDELPSFIMCASCGEIASIQKGGHRVIISEGD